VEGWAFTGEGVWMVWEGRGAANPSETTKGPNMIRVGK
jgi:hypothetical protein